MPSTLQDADAAALLLDMLLLVTKDTHILALAASCLRLSLTQRGSRLESQYVTLAVMGVKLRAAGKRGLFPKSLSKFFKPSNSRYFRVKGAKSANVTVMLLIGIVAQDHEAKVKQSSRARSSSSPLPPSTASG